MASSDSNPVSSPVGENATGNVLAAERECPECIAEPTQEVELQTIKVFIETPSGSVDFFHLSASTTGLDIIREKGCLAYWE